MTEERLKEIEKEIAYWRAEGDNLVRGGDQLADECTELIAAVRALARAARHARLALEAVVNDEQTIEAGLWRGEMLPRTIATIDEALGDEATTAIDDDDQWVADQVLMGEPWFDPETGRLFVGPKPEKPTEGTP